MYGIHRSLERPKCEMNNCYYCEKPVDRLPYDGKQRICERCKGRNPCTGKRVASTNIADFWTKPVQEQMKLAAFFVEPQPLTDEEKDEMAGCGC